MALAAASPKPTALADVRPSPAPAPRRFDRAGIALLSLADIQGLTCEDLVRIVQVAPPPTVSPKMLDCLEFQNREILERLAFLARECCRNRGG